MTALLTRHRYLSLVAALLLAFGLAACGGDDDDDNGDAAGDEPAATEDAGEDENGDDEGETEEPTEAPADNDDREEPADEGDDADGAGDGDALDELEERAAQSGPEQFKYVYDMTVDGETFTLTFARDGERNMYGIDGTFEGEDTNVVFISDGETTYVCSDEGGEGSCFEQPGTGAESFFGNAFLIDSDDIIAEATAQGADVTPAGGREIAGRDADCYEFSSPEGEGTMCLDSEESFVVYNEGEFGGVSQLMELVEASEPSDADFEPPYESMGSIGE